MLSFAKIEEKNNKRNLGCQITASLSQKREIFLVANWRHFHIAKIIGQEREEQIK